MLNRILLINIFNKLSRFSTKWSPFVVLYDWPHRKFVISRKVKKASLDVFLSKLWPRDIDGGLIRVGTFGDGGYLIPKRLHNVAVCYSAGVSDNSDFEFEFTNRYNCQVHMLDASVDGPALNNRKFEFRKLWLGKSTLDNVVGVNDWLATSRKVQKNQIFLKIDIEGCEYEVIKAISDESWEKIGCIVCEFHAFELILSNCADYRSDIFTKLLEMYDVVHLHPNNSKSPFTAYSYTIPSDVELTFVKKYTISSVSNKAQLPSSLDVPSTDKKDIFLNW